MSNFVSRYARGALYAALAFSCLTARADQIAYIGLRGGAFGTIDLNTGAYTPLGNSGQSLAGMAVANSTLFATAYDVANSSVYSVNPANGALTLIGSTGIQVFDFGSTTTGMYALDPNFNLYSINPATGVATAIGPTGQSFVAGTWNSLSNNADALYFSNGNNLYTLNTATGAATLVGSLGGSTQIAAMVFEDGTLYGGANSPSFTVDTLNPATGAATTGPGFTGGTFFALAPAPVPPPPPAIPNTYNCTELDIPGGTYTQLWRINNNGFIAGSSSLGAFIYNPNTGAWVQLPKPTVGPGFTAADLAVFNMSDSGTIVGAAQDNAINGGIEEGFILTSLTDPSSYTFFNKYVDPANPANNNLEFRGVSDNGLVAGWALNSTAFTGAGPVTAGGFVYNPTGAYIGAFAPGVFTTFDPVLSDGSVANFTQLAGINKTGLIAGSSASNTILEEGLLVGPNSPSFVQVPYLPNTLALRGVNAVDPFNASNCDAGGSCVRAAGFGVNAAGNHYAFYLDYDPNTGYVQAPQLISCSTQIPASANTFFVEGINDSDTIAGNYIDAGGNFHGVVGFAATTVPAGSCAASEGGCNLSNGDIPHSVSGGPSPLPGTVSESTCKVLQDPRIVQYGSCTGHSLPLAQVCPGFGTTVIPDSLCGGSGASGSGFVIADTVAEGVDALSGILVDSEAYANVALGTAPACPVTVGAWAPRSASAVEGTIPEGTNLVELTGGCGSSKIVSRGLSIYGIGLVLNTAALPGATLPEKLREFTQTKYDNLFQTIADGNMTFGERLQVNACVALSDGFFAFHRDGCAARTLVQCDAQVAQNVADFSGSATDPNVWGDIQGRLANLYFTINTRLLGNPPNTTWPVALASAPSCSENGP